MKTLDEVVKAFEWCLDDANDECDGCPYYEGHDGDCHNRNVDALHYLKEYRDECNNIINVHDDYIHLRNEMQDELSRMNPPLSWSELQHMEGKPVWVECKFYSHQWAIIGEVTENRIRFYGHRLVDGEPQEEMGVTWQAYRKERS